MYYENLNLDNFYSSLANKFEFNNTKITGNLRNYQLFLRNFIHPNTPYNGILLYHSTGSGKTLTSISILMNFLGKIDIYIFIKNKVLKKNFLDQIKQFYGNIKLPKVHFVSIATFSKQRNIDFSNSLIIIDEVQNVINNNIYDNLIRMKKQSNNIRMVLLTATPMFDNISEIFEISNLLNDMTAQLPIRKQLLSIKYVKEPTKYKSNPNFFLSGGNVLVLTEKGSDIITKYLHGKVSYIKVDTTTQDYPSSILKGTKYLEDKIVKCPMSKIQEQYYKNELENNKDVLYNYPSYYSIMPPVNKKDNPYNIKNLNKYSPKLFTLFNNIKKLLNKPGLIYIYSNYVNDSGVIHIINMLKNNGFIYNTNLRFDKNKMSYIYFDENTSENKKIQILNTFNSSENKNGDIIKIFIGSPMTSEGVNFKNIRQLHILDPYWNYSKMQQIIGRAIRYKSHENLPKTFRNVEIYKYASISKTAPFSIDLYKYELAIEKDKAIKHVEYILKKTAVDCFKFKTVLSSKYNNTRDCEYKKCNYTCDNVPIISKIDYSTYDMLLHNKEEYTFIKNELLKIIKKIKKITLNQIELHFQNYYIYIPNIYVCIQDLIDSNIISFNGKYYYEL